MIDRQVQILFSKGQDSKKNSLPTELQRFERDTQFMLDEDDEEYGEELEKNIENLQSLSPMQHFQKTTGVTVLDNGGANDYVQAVIQSILGIKCFAEFFMVKKFR